MQKKRLLVLVATVVLASCGVPEAAEPTSDAEPTSTRLPRLTAWPATVSAAQTAVATRSAGRQANLHATQTAAPHLSLNSIPTSTPWTPGPTALAAQKAVSTRSAARMANVYATQTAVVRPQAAASTLRPTSTGGQRNTATPTDGRNSGGTRTPLTAEAESVDSVPEIVNGYLDALKELKRLGDRAGRDPNLWHDPEWKAEVVMATELFIGLGTRLRAVDYPKSWERVEAQLMTAADLYDRFAIVLAQGLLESDGDKMNEAWDELSAAGRAMDAAVAVMKQVSSAAEAPEPSAIRVTARPTRAPTSTPQRSHSPAGICACSGDLYNCADFDTHSQAQACYRHCISVGAGDIHRLDADNDGSACEPSSW